MIYEDINIGPSIVMTGQDGRLQTSPPFHIKCYNIMKIFLLPPFFSFFGRRLLGSFYHEYIYIEQYIVYKHAKSIAAFPLFSYGSKLLEIETMDNHYGNWRNPTYKPIINKIVKAQETQEVTRSSNKEPRK